MKDAEKELSALLGNWGVPLDISIYVIEIFIQFKFGGSKTVRYAFFQLHNHFLSKKDLSARVLDKILKKLSNSSKGG